MELKKRPLPDWWEGGGRCGAAEVGRGVAGIEAVADRKCR